MLQYLIIILDNTSTSYCHYSVPTKERKLISLEDLKKGILFAMKENLSIQFVYPDYELPEAYNAAIEEIDHIKIKPWKAVCGEVGDVIVVDGLDSAKSVTYDPKKVYVLRIDFQALKKASELIKQILEKVFRLNIVITDVDKFSDEKITTYKEFLATLALPLEKLYIQGKRPQLNLLTDRLLLTQMNNCNAGDSNITLAPDGRFYVCPAFYYEIVSKLKDESGELKGSPYNLGCVETGFNLKNPQLYKLSCAPICRTCDAFQCKRCVWLNLSMTREVNTPSHEQCVMAHLERNMAKTMLANILDHDSSMPGLENFKEIDSLDPFDVLKDL